MNSEKSLLIAVFFLALMFLIPSKLLAQPRAYIPNINDTTVSVVDTGTNTLITNIEVGTRPSSAVVTPDGTKVYVTRNVDPAGSVVVIQTSTNTVLTTINVDRSPTDLAISPDGSTLWVANFNGVGSNRTISKIDTSTDMVVNTINLPMIGQSCNPSGIVAHPTLDFVYVIANCHRLLTIDTTTDMVLGTNRTVLLGENDIDITPDGSKIYVTDRFNSAVYIIDLPASGLPPTAVSDTISLSDVFCESDPLDVAVSPDNNFAWVMTSTTPAPNGTCNNSGFEDVNYVRIDTGTNASLLLMGDPFEIYSTIGFLRDGSSFYGLRITGTATEVQVSNAGVITVGTPITLGENGSRSTSPYFIGPDMSDLTIDKTGNGAGTVTSTPAGIDCGSDCTAVFPTDSDVDLSAVPDTGSEFTMWDQDCSGTNPDTTITLMTTSVCEAIFSLEQFNVNVNLAGTGSGTVTSNPAGINCPGTCSDMFDFDSNITLSESANADSDFIGWTGDPECTGGVINNLTADVTCIATFDLKMFTLTANKAGNGTGTITSAPPGINCGPACGSENSDFVINTNVTLTAAPTAADSEFAGWGGDCAAAGNNLNAAVTMDQARTCTANFALQQRTLTVDKTGTGDGTVTSAPPGINCGAGCTTENADFIINTMVTLTAAADGISSFSGWGGACAAAGTNASATVNMTDAMTCSADFTLEERTLTVNKSGNGDGTVTSNPAGINCGPGCTTDNAIYIINTMVTLTATPDGNSNFAGWDGACSAAGTSQTATVTLADSVTCTADFTLIQFTISISIAGDGDGRVTTTPEGINCPEDCTGEFDTGSVVVLNPIPDLGSVFTAFAGDPGCFEAEIIVGSDLSCVVVFVPQGGLLDGGEDESDSGCSLASGKIDMNSAGANLLLLLLPLMLLFRKRKLENK